MSDYPENVVPIATPETQTDPRQAVNFTADEALQLVAGVARRRGAVSVEVTILDDNDDEIATVHWSRAAAFRVAVIAQFPKHQVVGRTEKIERADWLANADNRWDGWQIIACAKLLEQFLPLHPSEVHHD